MVQAFGHRLEKSLDRLDLDPAVRISIRANLVKLGGLEVPASLDAGTAATVQADIRQAFIFGFRLIMLACSGLAMASAGVAWRSQRETRE